MFDLILIDDYKTRMLLSCRQDRMNLQRDALKQVKVGPDSMPSVCCYTLVNCASDVSAMEISDNSLYLAVGFGSGVHCGSIRVQSLDAVQHPLYQVGVFV